MFKHSLTLILALLLGACASRQLPSHVVGQFPTEKPPIQIFYKGEQLPQEQSSLLVMAHNPDQTYLYLTHIDEFKANKQGLIGGAKAANVKPGTHHLEMQFHDKHRLIMPLVLDNVTVEANTGYLINFSARYPEGYEDNQIDLNSDLAINIQISNLDNQEVIRDVTFNGWGKITQSRK